MNHFVVAIGREFGAQGCDIAEKLPKNLELNFMTDSLSRKLQRNLRWMSIPFRKQMRYLQKILRV